MEVKEITPDMIGTREIARANATIGAQEFNIPLDKIIIRENFNVRQDYGDLEGLADSIEQNGQVIAGLVDIMADGTFSLVEGHRRFKAMQIIALRGGEPLFKAVLNNRKMTEAERLLLMFTTQDSKPLLPHEVAEIIQRLVNMGWKKSQIAKKISRTASYVSQMLEYASESPVIKDHVERGDMTVTAALKAKKAIPVESERVKAVNKAVSEKKGKKVKSTSISDPREAKAEKLTTLIVNKFFAGTTEATIKGIYILLRDNL